MQTVRYLIDLEKRGVHIGESLTKDEVPRGERRRTQNVFVTIDQLHGIVKEFHNEAKKHK